MDGILVLNKPAEYTSFDCVAIARRAAGEKKTGHAGTLDPNATGVLVICFGKATRLIEYMDSPVKTYVCTAVLGKRTDSADIWGNQIPLGYQQMPFPDEKSLITALKSFEGDIQQTPPIYSAIKVNGRPLYKYARSGQEVEIKSRTVHVDSITLDSYSQTDGILSFTVVCSRGTYIRSICDDLGNLLQTGCVMTALNRTSSCGYTLSDAVEMDKLKSMESTELASVLKPYESAVSGLPRIYLSEKQAVLFLNGNNGFSEGLAVDLPEESPVAVFGPDSFLGIANVINGTYKSYKVFK